MTSIKVFVPYGAVGLNCTEEAFEAGLAMKPDIISSDAGSIPIPVLTTLGIRPRKIFHCRCKA